MFDIFYLDKPTGLFPHEQPANSILDACNKSRTRYCWIVNYLCDYTDFDFLWEPLPHQVDHAHVWPSQHQENSGTMFLPKSYVDVNYKHVPVLRNKSVTRVHIKHNHTSPDAGDYNVRYIDSYLGTMRRALAKVDSEYCWVTADVCDYLDFDFTWHPSEWQEDMLHVFPSDEQKFGDTFYVHVPSFLEKTQTLKTLGWFKTLNFVEIRVPRYAMPTVKYDTDSVVPAVWTHEFQDPLVQFYRDEILFDPAISLWEESAKTVVPLAKGATSVVIPRECKNYLKTQIYDYPYIDKSAALVRDSAPLDIIFVSNGEPNADYNWQWLETSILDLKDNRLARVDRVKGRVAAHHACARESRTDWYFLVPAKLQIRLDFDWTWQPDRMQQPKHYIFHARNPVNGLEYGHMAMIAFNKKLVLENTGQGLDFSLDQPHEVVPIVSGMANYANSPNMCWRTAFREVIKLKAALPDIEAEYRLNKWLTVADSMSSPYSDWSIYGAEDAVEYYEAVNGNFDELKKSYEWEWLASYALVKRGLAPD